MLASKSTPAAHAPNLEPTGLRWLRSAVTIALVLTLTFLIGLAVVGWSSTARAALAPLFSYTTKGVSNVALALTVLFILVTPTALFTFVARRQRLTWPLLALAWTVVLPMLAWLASDDPAIRRPLSIEEISPAFDGAEKSYAVLMRYSKKNPSDAAKAFAQRKLAVTWSGANARDAEKWQEFLVKNRAALEADWAALAPERAWFAELNTFDRIGDLAPADIDADIIRFDVWRALSQRATAIASLQMLDGHGDEAIATILPYLEVSRKLEPSSRTLVRTMVARVVQRLSLETLTFILNRHTPSPALRARLETALAGGNGPAGARRLLLVEYPAFSSLIEEMRPAGHLTAEGETRHAVTGPLALLGPLLFNPNATVNRYADFLYDLAALAEARELGKLAVRGGSFEHDFLAHHSPKNLGGALLLNTAVPAFDKVVKSYWEIEDLRTALHARVVALPH